MLQSTGSQRVRRDLATEQQQQKGGPAVKCRRFYDPNSGSPGSTPGQGTRSHMPQLRACMPQLKISHAATKIKDPACHN